MTGLVSRSLSLATSAERGNDDRSLGEDAPAPEDVRHEIERIDRHSRAGYDGPPYDQCVHCRLSRPADRINPYTRCPKRDHASPIDRWADAAEADAGQAMLSGARLASDGGGEV